MVTVALIGLSASLVWNPYFLNSALSIAGVVVLALGSKTHWRVDPLHRFQQVIGFFLGGWPQVWRDSAIVGRWRESGDRGEASSHSSGFGQRWLIPVLICGLFLVLFALANPLVANWIDDLVQIILNPLQNFEWPPLRRIFLWIIIFCYTWAMLRYRPGLMSAATAVHSGSKKVAELATLDTIIRSLILLNVLFALMNLLDLRYLWYGAALPDGMNYAEYAQRGAYPLVLSALLAAFFVLITFRVGGAAEKSRVAVILVGLWVAQNILLTVSAGWRLGIYIDVYSLTRLRMAAAIWMGLVATGLLWISLRILLHKSNAWLVNRNAAMLGVVLFICAFINFDGYIARYNVERCEELTGKGAPLDWRYLKLLGVEALPALQTIETPAALPREFLRERRTLEKDLKRKLSSNLEHWQSWTVLRYRLSRLSDG